VEADNEALGFTEAPETLAGLFRQRFRWTFGTLQCLWKHRDALGYENVGLDPSASPALSRIGSPSTPTGRQIFVKLSYLFRF